MIEQAIALALVGLGITLLVYGAVALVVKADDIGLALARGAHTGFGRAFGRALPRAMPTIMQILSIVGTAAMIWVGGGIFAHGLASFGFSAIEHAVEALAEWAALAATAAPELVSGLVTIIADFAIGLALGFLLLPVVQYAVTPIWKFARSTIADWRGGK